MREKERIKHIQQNIDFKKEYKMGSSLKSLALKGLRDLSFLTLILSWLNQRINRFPETLASILPLSWEVFS